MYSFSLVEDLKGVRLLIVQTTFTWRVTGESHEIRSRALITLKYYSVYSFNSFYIFKLKRIKKRVIRKINTLSKFLFDQGIKKKIGCINQGGDCTPP